MPQQIITGKVLTRRLKNLDKQNFLEYFIATEQGCVQVDVAAADWVCFCHQSDLLELKKVASSVHFQAQAVELRSFTLQPVCALYVKSSRDMTLLRRISTEYNIALFEADIRPEHRFLIERFIAFDVDFIGQFEPSSDNTARFTAEKARKAIEKTDVKLKSVSLDFECSMEGELYSVGLYSETHQSVFMVGEDVEGSPEYLHYVNDERQLIFALLDWFTEHDPDIIIGWAVVTFDLSLLYRRAKLHGIPLTLGRKSSLLTWKVENKHRPETLSLPGRVVLDGIDWLKAAFYQFDSFSLEFVSQQLLGEGKAIDEVKNRGNRITELFHQDKLALAHYNLTDCRLVWEIFENTQLWQFAIARSELTGLELGRVGASVAAFNNLYLPHLHRSGYVAPQFPASQGLESPGGYVMASVPGLYKNVLVLDFKSLYPSIIRTFLIDPKGLIEGQEAELEERVSGFLGAEFHRHNSILPSLIANLDVQRDLAKKENNQPLSQAIKIIMNSMYGVLGSTGCVFHDAKLASSITMRGHEIMKQTRVWIEELGYKVIYGDTDSTFVWVEDIDANFSKIGNDLVKKVNCNWQKKLQKEYQLDSFLVLEFEKHYEQFFMPTLRGSEQGSKKRYVGQYRDKNKQLTLSFKGMENVRQDWSKIARRIQFELFDRLFSGKPLSHYLSEQLTQLKNGELDNELIFIRKLTRPLEDYTAKSSPHVKVANHLLALTGDKKFSKRGCKIEYINTISGAESVYHKTSPIDYDYYIDKQIKPIAEPIFDVTEESLVEVLSNQLSLI
ncbi:DNA polymerase II [Parashewanella curva]|uniref:DNA polymerase n=1 Tax=Parashewanella curva TaxID=2338552 RepID=A0A3L8Q1Z2_9GAMM|nr:DNA polymerase II [Parashewanella curva]RLV60332.1 DNA polymerase II [Parashewanella curva]